MNELEKQPIDPFASIDLDAFKTRGDEDHSSNEVANHKKEIKNIAEKSHFSSRQAPPKKQKLVTKTFSLFQDEIIIINNALRAFIDSSDELSSPSNSDAVRAGLHLLAQKSPEEQARLISEHRGRGRK